MRKKIIFISNGSDYKGTNEFLKLANYANTEKINCDFYWITDQKYCDNKKKEFAKKISNLFIIPPCKHSDLKSIMQNSDFLFFSTKVGVGYGQVTLEALACGMELLILNPVGDCLSLYSSIYYRSIAEIISRLMEEYPPRNFNFPSTMLEENLKKQYLQYFAGKLE